jgi:hypothetical protein
LRIDLGEARCGLVMVVNNGVIVRASAVFDSGSIDLSHTRS